MFTAVSKAWPSRFKGPQGVDEGQLLCCPLPQAYIPLPPLGNCVILKFQQLLEVLQLNLIQTIIYTVFMFSL